MRKDGGWRAAIALYCALSATVCLGFLQKPPSKRFGISGGVVTLETEVNDGTSLSDISWKKGKDLVAELDPELWVAPRFQGRAKLDSTKGSLTLTQLQQNDSGEYRAEVVVEGQIQSTFLCLHILEPPKPPQLNCTAIDDRIQVNCTLDDLYATINLTYKWEYQKSNKQIPGNSSEIWLEKDVDLSENITCVIHVLDANASSSIRLRSCTQTGATPQIRDRARLLAPFVVLPLTAGIVFCLWKRGCFNLKRKGKSQECDDGTDAAEAPPETQCLRDEPSGDLEDNSSKGPSDPGT